MLLSVTVYGAVVNVGFGCQINASDVLVRIDHVSASALCSRLAGLTPAASHCREVVSARPAFSSPCGCDSPFTVTDTNTDFQ